MVNAADSEGGRVDCEPVQSALQRYEGMALRGRTDMLPEWILGIGFGVPLVPEVWKTCDTEDLSRDIFGSGPEPLEDDRWGSRTGRTSWWELRTSSAIWEYLELYTRCVDEVDW